MAKAVLRVANPLAVHPELVTILGWVVADLDVHFPSFERGCFSIATIANNRMRQDISATPFIEGGTRQCGTFTNTVSFDSNAYSYTAHATFTVVCVPTTKEQCKNGGWRGFGYPNQGTCISDVNRRNQ